MATSPGFIKLALTDFAENNAWDENGKKILPANIRNIRNVYLLNEMVGKITRQIVGEKPIDFSVVSPHILQSFLQEEGLTPHRQEDFQWLFLHHIILQHQQKLSLIQYINSFIETYKQQLVAGDLVITNSGATRCKTALRFALHSLRELGLVIGKDENEHRSWRPSIMGIILLLAASADNKLVHKFSKLNRSAIQYGEARDTESLHTSFESYYPKLYDKQLLRLIAECRQPGALYGLLQKAIHDSMTAVQKRLIENLQTNYLDTVLRGLEISGEISGVKETRVFNQLSDDFHTYLAKQDDEHALLTILLLNIYRKQHQQETP